MFLGWYDPDKKKPARAKLAEAIERYEEKFGDAPAACLTNAIEATELAGDKQRPPLDIRGVAYIPRFTFYVGVEDEPAEMLVAA